ncbi:MAG: hypothetical protein H7834_13280, partial [Magnetococcus sp. YQC-9]
MTATAKSEPAAENRSAPVTPHVTTPHLEVKIPEALTKNADHGASTRSGEPKAEAPKAPARPPTLPPPAGPMQQPGPTTFNLPTAGMPPPQPRPPAEEPADKSVTPEGSYTVQ